MMITRARFSMRRTATLRSAVSRSAAAASSPRVMAQIDGFASHGPVQAAER
jgi:hypothetical protein